MDDNGAIQARNRDAILSIERELAEGDDETYRKYLTDDALVVVPGASMSKDETLDAMSESPGWGAVSLDDPDFFDLADGVVLLSYSFHGERGGSSYDATLSSVYVEAGDGWRLAFHQQTPTT